MIRQVNKSVNKALADEQVMKAEDSGSEYLELAARRFAEGDYGSLSPGRHDPELRHRPRNPTSLRLTTTSGWRSPTRGAPRHGKAAESFLQAAAREQLDIDLDQLSLR